MQMIIEFTPWHREFDEKLDILIAAHSGKREGSGYQFDSAIRDVSTVFTSAVVAKRFHLEAAQMAQQFNVALLPPKLKTL
jgi:hypothetical protein